ncbi:MAG: two-component regulator propeller domain-containing protein [Thermoanaerobaculia bacterium]
MLRRSRVAPALAAAALSMLVPASPLAGQSYLVHVYNSASGLPTGEVTGVAQDGEGRIWFATRAGFVSYDGSAWERHATPEPGVARDYIFLKRDARGVMWTVSSRWPRLLATADGHEWMNNPGPGRTEGTMVVVMALEVATVDGETAVAVGTADRGLYIWHRKRWTHVDLAEGLPSSSIRALAADGGGFWAATGSGLARVTPAGAVTSATSLLPEEARDLLAVAVGPGRDPAGVAREIWVLSTRGLGHLVDGVYSWKTTGLRFEFSQPSIPAVVFPDPDANVVYFCSYHPFYRLDLGSGMVETLGRANGLAGDGATALLLDRERNLWVTGYRGVSKLVSRRFANWSRLNGLLDDEVTAIAEPRAGRLVFGHNQGLTILEGAIARTVPFPVSAVQPRAVPRVLDMAADGSGGLWVAASQQGLGHLRKDGSIRFFRAGPGAGNDATSVLSLPGGNALVGTRSSLLRFDGSRFEPAMSSVPQVMVRHLVRTRDGAVWIATNTGGLLVLESGRLREVPESDGRKAEAYNVFEDRRGRLWALTATGPRIVRDGRLVRPDEPALGIEEPTFSAVEDADGRLWFGTAQGVLRWDGASLVRFTPREGLGGWETNRAAVLLDTRGRLWFGTDGGASEYRREEDRTVAPPPIVTITAVEVKGRSASATAPLELSPGDDTLTFRFRAVSFLDEKQTTCRTRLEGLDSDWSAPHPASEREVRFTNLPPGRFRFQIRATNAAGITAPDISSAYIVIPPPLVRRGWFLVLSAVVLAAGIVVAFQSAVHWRAAARLEREVAARTAALAESETRYRRLFADPSSPKLLVEPEGVRVVDANDSACALLGVPPGGAVGKSASELGAPWLVERVAAVRDTPSGAREAMRARLPGKEDRSRDVESLASIVTLGGRPLVLVTLQDVTERLRLEEERIKSSKLESLGLLAGGLAHDFNNILTAAVGHIALARRNSLDSRDASGNLDEVERALMRAKGLTDQIRTFAKGGAPIRRMTDLRPLLFETAAFALSGSRSTLDLKVAPDLWPAEVDAGQLAQVIGNLVLNAHQAMPDGGPITLVAENTERRERADLPLPDGPCVRITVTDRGPGIPEEVRASIFDPYFTTRAQGAGLGLTTSFAIAKRHGGHLAVTASSPEGTTMTLWLPAAPGAEWTREEEPGESAPRERVAPAASPAGIRRILVMDDEPAIRGLYSQFLPMLGYEAVAVPDGEAAIRAFEEGRAAGTPFDGVLLDLTVPGGMGGVETLAALRSRDPDVKVIVASGYSADAVLAHHRKAGFDGVLRKPFRPSELSAALAALVGKPLR